MLRNSAPTQSSGYAPSCSSLSSPLLCVDLDHDTFLKGASARSFINGASPKIMMFSSTFSARVSSPWDDDGHSDRPSTRSSNEPPDHAAHFRSRSTAHPHTNHPKRLSVFSGRSRSNTTTSTSSYRSPNSSMTSSMNSSVDGSFVSSQDERTSSALGLRDKPERSSRSFLARGSRILRRQGSKINVVATLDEEDEVDREKPHGDKAGRRGRQIDYRKSRKRKGNILN